MFCVVRSKQHSPHHHHSSKLGSSSSPGENYVDYMILETPQSPMNMQTASMDPYMYHQVDKTSFICVKRQGSGIRCSKLYIITMLLNWHHLCHFSPGIKMKLSSCSLGWEALMPAPPQGPRPIRESGSVTDSCYRKLCLYTWHPPSHHTATEGLQP